MIFSGLLILENGAQSQGHNNQVPAVSQGPKLSTFTFNYTPRTGQYWDVDFNGQVQVSSGSHITFTAPAGNYSYEILTPQGYFSGHALVKLSGVPWWYTVGSSALAGASIGFIVGGPIGALVGGIAGGIVGAIIAYFFGSSGPQSAQQLALIEQEQSNTMVGVMNQINEAISLISVINSLTETSYYYFAQEMEAVAERYMNSSFNESQLLISSGVLNQIAHILQPVLDVIGYSYVELYNFELDSSAGPTTSACSGYGFDVQNPLSGMPLDTGQYYWLDGNNTYFYGKSLNVEWQNAFTGAINYVNSTVKTSVTYEYYPTTATGCYVYPGGTSYLDGYIKSNLTGLYKLVSVSAGQGSAFTDAISMGTNWNGPLDSEISFNQNKMYAGDQYDAAGTYTARVVYRLNPSSTSGLTQGTCDLGGTATNQVLYCYNYNTSQIGQVISTSNTAFTNSYESASTFINKLEGLGYTNYSQIPANETIPFPSWFVPASMLNGTFNETELYALYVAYLESLNNTFHHEKQLTGNDSINQTIFGGFAQESGTLNLSNSYSGHKEINGTFLIEINQGKLNFQVGQKTIFTAQTPVIVINGYYGDPTFINGSLIQASANSTFYTTAIVVNGTSEQSYTLSGQLIKVYLYAPGNLTPIPSLGVFLTSKIFEEYLIIAVLVIVILAAVIVGMGRKGHKDKKKRTN